MVVWCPASMLFSLNVWLLSNLLLSSSFHSINPTDRQEVSLSYSRRLMWTFFDNLRLFLLIRLIWLLIPFHALFLRLFILVFAYSPSFIISFLHIFFGDGRLIHQSFASISILYLFAHNLLPFFRLIVLPLFSSRFIALSPSLSAALKAALWELDFIAPTRLFDTFAAILNQHKISVIMRKQEWQDLREEKDAYLA